MWGLLLKLIIEENFNSKATLNFLLLINKIFVKTPNFDSLDDIMM